MGWHNKLKKCQEFGLSGISWCEGSNDATEFVFLRVLALIFSLLNPSSGLYIVVR